MSLRTAKPTPASIFNRPGLPKLDARAGTYAQFVDAMRQGLADANRPGLSELGARTEGDWTLGIFDAWAATCATLTFYAERAANEAYLDTATMRESVRAHARLIGYELAPAKAASMHLAFTAEENDAPETILSYPPGLQMRSIPRDGELPQVFETVGPLNARARWNALRPRMWFPQELSPDTDTLRLKPGEPGLRPGDPILFLQGDTPIATAGGFLRRVAGIDGPAGGARIVALKSDPAPPPIYAFVAAPLLIGWPTGTAVTSAELGTNLLAYSVPQGGLAGSTALAAFQAPVLSLAISALTFQPPDPPIRAVKLCTRAGFFGNVAQSAPLTEAELDATSPSGRGNSGARLSRVDETGLAAIKAPPRPARIGDTRGDVGDVEPPDGSLYVYLDREVDDIVAGSVALIRDARQEALARVRSVEPMAVAAYGLATRVTRLELDAGGTGPAGEVALFHLSTRTATIYAAPADLPLDTLPITASPGVSDGDLGPAEIELGTAETDLAPGMVVAITGERADLTGVMASEVREIAEVTLNAGFTVLTFTQPLAQVYRRETVVLNANVAEATHGETVVEILGDGDATRPFAEFALKSVPLTHVAARTESGTAPALEVRVDGVRYDLMNDFAGAGPEDAIHILRIGEDGVARVIFGDGITGARLPTGQDNVVATYRRGAGMAGMLEAGQISLLSGKPAGLRGGVNPLAPAGGADGELLENARENAPLKVLTLGRVVSLRDYADFARGFAAVAKARADWTFDGVARPIFVTVAGQNGVALPEDGADMANLRAALRAAGEADQRVTLRNHVAVRFSLAARLFVDPAYQPEDVIAAARDALALAFSFDARALGQGVSHAQAIAVLQSVPGVTGVDLDAFHRTSAPASLEPRVNAAVARPDLGGAVPVPAELLTIDIDSSRLEAVT